MADPHTFTTTLQISNNNNRERKKKAKFFIKKIPPNQNMQEVGYIKRVILEESSQVQKTTEKSGSQFILF